MKNKSVWNPGKIAIAETEIREGSQNCIKNYKTKRNQGWENNGEGEKFQSKGRKKSQLMFLVHRGKVAT
jgi:hypothetical protein